MTTHAVQSSGALAWWLFTGLIWLGGGLAPGNFRVAIWVIAAIGEYGGVWLGFPVPGLGRSSTTDYTIAGEHMAERCHGFVILALGESIVLTGANFGQLPSTAATAAAFAVAFVGTVAFWWVYFDRAAEAGRRVIAAASDPGRLGVSAYTYDHLPMIAGIIVAAAAYKLTIAHPGDSATTATAALILGGPALYLTGNALFQRALWGHIPRSRPLAILTLAALAPLAIVATTLELLTAATLIVVTIAAHDSSADH
jgi:low temperature requirement protein LtrA